ncbi:MAG TPA: hypothetical protein VGV89_03990 [Thermoplasmata archaeon]|nr:hypothetical protein [Thermoplasmata archaeon]
MSSARGRPLVIKFGALALEEPDRVVSRVATEYRAGHRPIVVVSARRGVTDALLDLMDGPADSERVGPILRRIALQHQPSTAAVEERLGRLRSALAELRPGHELSRRRAGAILSEGERLAARWLASRLRRAGLRAVPFDADRLGLLIAERGGGAHVLVESSKLTAPETLGAVVARGQIPVVTGFFGADPRGGVTTLTRGGSDSTAVAVAALMEAREVVLVKGSGPVRMADPAIVPTAPVLGRLGYSDALVLALAGAKVLHPEAVELARTRHITLRVGSVQPEAPETRVGPDRGTPPFRAVAVRDEGMIRAPARSPRSPPLPMATWSGLSGAALVGRRPTRRPAGVGGATLAGSGRIVGAAASSAPDPPRDVSILTWCGPREAGVALGRDVVAAVRLPREVARRGWGAVAIPRELGQDAVREIYRRLVQPSSIATASKDRTGRVAPPLSTEGRYLPRSPGTRSPAQWGTIAT